MNVLTFKEEDEEDRDEEEQEEDDDEDDDDASRGRFMRCIAIATQVRGRETWTPQFTVRIRFASESSG